MKRLLILLSAITVLTFASGCGQSGPLYLPGNPSQIEPPVEEPAETDEDEDEEKSQREGAR